MRTPLDFDWAEGLVLGVVLEGGTFLQAILIEVVAGDAGHPVDHTIGRVDSDRENSFLVMQLVCPFGRFLAGATVAVNLTNVLLIAPTTTVCATAPAPAPAPPNP